MSINKSLTLTVNGAQNKIWFELDGRIIGNNIDVLEHITSSKLSHQVIVCMGGIEYYDMSDVMEVVEELVRANVGYTGPRLGCQVTAQPCVVQNNGSIELLRRWHFGRISF